MSDFVHRQLLHTIKRMSVMMCPLFKDSPKTQLLLKAVQSKSGSACNSVADTRVPALQNVVMTLVSHMLYDLLELSI